MAEAIPFCIFARYYISNLVHHLSGKLFTMNKSLVSFGILLAGIIGINWLSSFIYTRIDLTEDKRYSVSEATVSMLNSLQGEVEVMVYLSGDFPPGFERLENATREMLEEFSVHAGNKLSFEFIDPSDAPSESQRQENYNELMDMGLIPTNLFANEGGKRTERLIFPGAIVKADTTFIPVQLLKGNKSGSSEEQLNQSYEEIEFGLASAIKKLTQQERRKIGLAISHTHIAPARLSDLIATIQQEYDVFLDINIPESYDGLDALLVLKPDSAFSEEEKYKLDQYLMSGGNLLFFTDGVQIDSIGREGTFGQPLDLNLQDLFFKWGVRLNYDLIKDLNCAQIPLNIGNMGEAPQIQPLPWRFFPLINNFGKHPVTRNMDALYTRFISSIDTIKGTPDIIKTPLLMTSPYTRTLNAPVFVSYTEARNQPESDEYTGGEKLTGILLEGSFSSLYQNRILPSDPRHATFIPEGDGGKIILVSDGDLIVNDFDNRREAPYPLGFDRVSRHIFANRDFVLNALEYMTDENGLITSRNKEVKIRMLDKVKIHEERFIWQAANLLIPVLAIIFGGLCNILLRKRKFTSK